MVKMLVNNPKYMTIIHFSVVILGGVIFQLVEKKDLFSSIYWSFITTLTIGYGDISPTLPETRVLAVILGYFGIITIAILVATILNSVLIDKEAFTNDEQEWLEKMVCKLAKKLDVEVDEAPENFHR